MDEIMPDTRVLVYDSRDFKDDVSTPCSMLYRPATVVRRYGQKCHYPVSEVTHTYDDLVDVIFDHRPRDVSNGHFTRGVKLLVSAPPS